MNDAPRSHARITPGPLPSPLRPGNGQRSSIDWDELTALTAFHGAVFGVIGTLGGMLGGDIIFAVVASGGACVCTGIWIELLQSGAADEKLTR